MSLAKQHISLIGFSGSGKSTVGPLLAKKLHLGFMDVDSLIEKEYRATIPEIFARKSERGFRLLESKMISRLFMPSKKASVIALGGGAFIDRTNRSLIQGNSTVIWQSCSVREIYRRIRDKSNRPLLNINSQSKTTTRMAQLERITVLLSKRLPAYRLADIRVATTERTTGQVVTEILRKLREFNATS